MITIILIILLFFIKISPRGVIDPNAVSIRQDSGEIQYQYSGGDWKKIISLDELRGKDGRSIEVQQDPPHQCRLSRLFDHLYHSDH